MAGFISVDMADNGNGNPNEYNKSSFKQMIKDTQTAIKDGFDVFVLLEGQLNPTPENGLQPILPGAFALAKTRSVRYKWWRCMDVILFGMLMNLFWYDAGMEGC